MSRVPLRAGWVVLLLAAVASTWISPFRRELLAGDETKYSRIVYESVLNGPSLILRLEGEPYTHKPPLHFWLMEGLARVFGATSIWPFVLPSLMFFMIVTAIAGWTTMRIAGGDPIAGGAIFATFCLSWIMAQTARMDLELVALISLGALLIYEALENLRWTLLPLAGVALGLGVLVKGPMAWVIGVCLFAIEAWTRRREHPAARVGSGRLPVIVVSLVVMVAIPVVWFVPAMSSGGPDWGREVIFDQILGRAVGAEVHAEPIWFYLLRFPLTFFPWFAIVALAAVRASRLVAGEERRRLRFLVHWFLTVLVAFSLVRSKLDVYMLPAMVPAAALGADYLRRLGDDQRRTGSLSITFVVGLIATAVAVVLLWMPPDEPEIALIDGISRLSLFGITAAAAGGLLIQSLWLRRPAGRALVLGFVALAPLLWVVLFLLPMINGSVSSRPLVESLRRTRVSPEEIGLYWTPHLWARSMPASYHAVRYDEVEELRSDPPPVLALRRDHASDLGDLLDGYERIDHVRMIGKDFDVYRRTD